MTTATERVTHPADAPDWASDANEWRPDVPGDRDVDRFVRHHYRWPEGAGVEVSAHQRRGADGALTLERAEVFIDPGDGAFEDTVDIRQLAAWLRTAADMVDAINAAGSEGWAPGAFSSLIAHGVAHLRRVRDIRHNELGIGTGIGPDHLSQKMAGRVLFDLHDLERLARELRVKPEEIIRTGLRDDLDA